MEGDMLGTDDEENEATDGESTHDENGPTEGHDAEQSGEAVRKRHHVDDDVEVEVFRSSKARRLDPIADPVDEDAAAGAYDRPMERPVGTRCGLKSVVR